MMTKSSETFLVSKKKAKQSMSIMVEMSCYWPIRPRALATEVTPGSVRKNDEVSSGSEK